jgi:hypothetical protein
MGHYLSNKSTFRQRHAGAVADDDVIQQAYVHQAESFLDPLSDQFVGLAGLGDSGRMLGFIRECQHGS